MRNKKFIFIITFITLLIWSPNSFSLQEKTHQVINESVAQNTVNGFSLNVYLKNNLGLKKGVEEVLTGFDADGINVSKEAFWWLGYGGIQEDRPGEWYDYLPVVGNPTRSVNHFHNPLKHWSEAGLNDRILGILSYTGQSQVLWAQNSSQDVGGKWSWQDARRYFYIALTGRNFDGSEVAKTKADKDAYYAYTFRAVGQLMHLVQDASVPEHTRNDAHVLPAYEKYVENLMKSTIWEQWMSNPSPPFDPLIFKIPTVSLAPIPISRIIDTDFYNGQNPEITANSRIGIAEYTNANFLSRDTMFTDDLDTTHRHYAPYPKGSNAILWTDPSNSRRYLKKADDGEPITHLAVASILYNDRLKYFPQYNHALPVGLDDMCYKKYAEKLIPRAVGYSAGLLNYFFRGDIRLSYETSDTPGYVFVNNTGEKMEGDFVIFYDKAGDERVPLWAGRGTLEATIGDKTNTFDFIPPSDAKEPGKYIVVFKGEMGNEDGAVAGYVLQRLLEITPPDQFVYSMVDANQSDPYFTSIKAKVKNASPSEAIQNGVIQAIAKYKTDIDDVDFSYSMSAPRSISSLASDQATEFEFNFSNDPIPVDVTDLYLQVIFKGTIGNENNAVAIGLKDISEPTPIDVFNNMDRICINGSWYVTGTPEAYDALPPDAKLWDYWSHDLENEYIKISPVKDPCDACDASPTNYTFYRPLIEAGTLYRRFILCDYEFMHSGYGTMVPKDPNDHATHDNVIKKGTAQGGGVRNQEEYTTDQAVCSEYGLNAPCTVRRTSSFYPFRGVEMWGPGGIIVDGLTYPNYTDPNYIPCKWDDLNQ